MPAAQQDRIRKNDLARLVTNNNNNLYSPPNNINTLFILVSGPNVPLVHLLTISMASAVFYSMDVKASRNHSIPDGIIAGRFKRFGWLNAIKNAIIDYLVKGEID